MSGRFITHDALDDLCDLPATSRWVRGRVGLHVLDYGGDGPEIVLIPGISMPAIGMDFVARELVGLGHPFVLDVRGRGLSQNGERYSLADYAEDTEAVISELGMTRPFLVGHSMGARIAALVAARGVVRVAGSVIVDPPLSGPGRAPYPTTRQAFLAQLAEARRGTDADEVAKAWPRWPRREQELRARWLASCDETALGDTHTGFESEDFFEFWPRIASPVAFVYGAQSPVVTPEGALEAARANPLARMVRVDDAAHMVFWDNPDAARSTLADLLQEMLRPSVDPTGQPPN